MEKMSQLIVRLEIASRRATLNNNDGKNPLSLRTKLLFLLYSGLSLPTDFVSELCLNKSNLALLTRELVADGFVVKQRRDGDKREISMAITKKGVEHLESCLSKIEKSCESAFGGGYDEAAERLAAALDVLDFI